MPSGPEQLDFLWAAQLEDASGHEDDRRSFMSRDHQVAEQIELERERSDSLECTFAPNLALSMRSWKRQSSSLVGAVQSIYSW